MRALAVVVMAAAGFAAMAPNLVSAAELDLGDGCARGQVWNGYRCEWARPRVSEAPPAYEEAPVYEQAPVYRAPEVYAAAPVYVAPPVYVARPAYVAPPVYVAPVYRAPVVRYYAGPRYVWGYGHRWRR